MEFNGIFNRSLKLLSDNAPTILTTAAVIGTFTTAYLTGRATFIAADLIKETEEEHGYPLDPVLRARMRARYTWQLYVPPITTGLVTIACIVAANQIGSRRTAAAMAAFMLSEKALDEYKDKVVEKLGANKERKIRDEIAQDRVTEAGLESNAHILEDGLSVLCYDLFTARPFISDIETLRQAQNDINHQLLGDMYVSLSEFYDRIGLARTSMSDDFGWNIDKMLELQFSTTMTPNGRPCITMDFRVAPIRGYNRLQ